MPQIPGLKESRWFTNDTIFALTELPKSLLVIGAGPIGCELGQAFARFGSKVTIATKDALLLPKEDEDASEMLAAQFRAEGIDIIDELKAVSGFDAVLVSAGRKPNVEDLNLPAAEWQSSGDRQAGSWWPRWGAWLAHRSGGQIPARTPGDSTSGSAHPVLCAAPGTYVTAPPSA